MVVHLLLGLLPLMIGAELLTNAVKNNKTSHSYMFVGTEGIGKKMIAKEFAKMI